VNVYLDFAGCRVNQSEIEAMARECVAAGHHVVASAGDCDVAVVNTCSVTAAAASDSRSLARRAHRLNPSAPLILTGCWSTLEPEVAAVLPGVARVIPNTLKGRLVSELREWVCARPRAAPARPAPRRTRAFIKVQEGCDNHCTFCATVLSRGASRSLPVADVLAQVRAAEAGGAKEAVLTGVELSAYGRDLPCKADLTTLVRAVLADTRTLRLRLSSLEPWGLPDGFLDLWSNSRLCRHLHLPLQSGSGSTLRRMGRPIHPGEYACLARRARQAIPDLALTTDLIAGFPGETDEEFAESLRFVEGMAFARAHVFTYSARAGTPAARLPGQIAPVQAQRRSGLLREACGKSAAAFLSGFLGRKARVLWETPTELPCGKWRLSGLTDNYLRVEAESDEGLHGCFSSVRLTRLTANGLFGEFVA
jgi:threonylcarbamoyladenosine tRNA methylthiotransferase MtaB